MEFSCSPDVGSLEVRIASSLLETVCERIEENNYESNYVFQMTLCSFEYKTHFRLNSRLLKSF